MSAKEEFCSVGLLGFALTGNTTGRNLGECGTVLADIIRDNYPDRVPLYIHGITAETANAGVIMAFNDHPDTSFADVERVFEKAEVAWDERI